MEYLLLHDKTILITGAGSGIGRATAVVASQMGANVIMLDLSEDGLKDTLAKLSGGRHYYYVIDLINNDELSCIVKEIVAKNGLINGLSIFIHLWSWSN